MCTAPSLLHKIPLSVSYTIVSEYVNLDRNDKIDVRVYIERKEEKQLREILWLEYNMPNNLYGIKILSVMTVLRDQLKTVLSRCVFSSVLKLVRDAADCRVPRCQE